MGRADIVSGVTISDCKRGAARRVVEELQAARAVHEERLLVLEVLDERASATSSPRLDVASAREVRVEHARALEEAALAVVEQHDHERRRRSRGSPRRSTVASTSSSDRLAAMASLTL